MTLPSTTQRAHIVNTAPEARVIVPIFMRLRRWISIRTVVGRGAVLAEAATVITLDQLLTVLLVTKAGRQRIVRSDVLAHLCRIKVSVRIAAVSIQRLVKFI